MGGGGQSKQQQATDNSVASSQLAMQQQYLNQYNNYVQQLIHGGGYLPGVKEALTSQAINSVPQQYNQVAQQLQTNLGARGAAGGGSQPASGLYGRGLGELYSAEEQNKSGLLNQITAQGQQNIAAGETGILNAAGNTAGVGSSALGGATTAAGNADQASSSLWGGIIGGALGVAGDAVKKCWVAAELYNGWFTPETCAIRNWLWSTWYMKPFCSFYLAFGEQWAAFIRSNKSARKLTKKLFDLFLRQANA